MPNLFNWFGVLSVVISIIYVLTITWFIIGWNKIKKNKTILGKNKTKVTVILPYHNENENIENCLLQLCNQEIDTLEYNIIAINDFSTDQSEKIVTQLTETYPQIKKLNNDKKGKKNAITKAVKSTESELIVTTDADCYFSKYWLQEIVSFWRKHKPKLIIAPVTLTKEKGFWQKFQQLEFNSLIMATGGSCGIQHPIMCNGANLAFCRETYLSIKNPHNDKYLSGDDVFLMHNIKKIFPKDILFLKSKNAIVKTKSKKGLKPFIKQRNRWTSKSTGYNDNDTRFTAIIVLLHSFLFVFGTIILIFNYNFLFPIIVLYLSKTIIDYIFFYKTKNFLGHQNLMKLIPIFEIIYCFYVMFIFLLSICKSNQKQHFNK